MRVLQKIISLFTTAKIHSVTIDQQDAFKPTRLQVSIWILLVFMAVTISLSNYQAFQLGVYADDATYVIYHYQQSIHSDFLSCLLLFLLFLIIITTPLNFYHYLQQS